MPTLHATSAAAPPAYRPSDAAPPSYAQHATTTTKDGSAAAAAVDVDAADTRGGAVAYVGASVGVWASYVLRVDGAVARFKSGAVQKLLRPPEKTTYVAVSGGEAASYLLRSDGVIDRVTTFGCVTSQIHAPGTAKYTAVSAGSYASYFLRDDGVVDRTRSGGKLDRASFVPPVGVSYTAASAGTDATYLVRSDGVIDRVTSPGSTAKVQKSIVCGGGGGGGGGGGVWTGDDRYVGVSRQVARSKDDKGNGANSCTYFIRASGSVDVTRAYGNVCSTLNPPPGTKYTSATVGQAAAYLLRSDGAIDRACAWQGFEVISKTMAPPPHARWRYTGASYGDWYSLLTRSDGLVDYTAGGGKVTRSILPPPPGAISAIATY